MRDAASGLEDATARYSLLEPIGEGGMGTVHLAVEHLADGGKKRVAVKRMRPQATKDPRNLELFFREARLAAMLRHPNVAHALSFGRIAEEPYIAMEYIEGRTLDAVLDALKRRGQTLDIDVACLIASDLCEGLHAVHTLTDHEGRALGVVHRDVTPHNVIVDFDGGVRLLDFGIAKVTEESSKLTRTGEVRGKMAYMSPEQALGERVEARSDLFGVGAVFYECMTGQRMWGEGTELELMRKLALEEPPTLAREGCDATLGDLQQSLVAKKPADRPASADRVAKALVAHTNDGTRGHLRSMMRELFAADKAAEAARLAQVLDASAPAEPFSAAVPPLPREPEHSTPAFVQSTQKPRSGSAMYLGIGSLGLVLGILAFAKFYLASGERVPTPGAPIPAKTDALVNTPPSTKPSAPEGTSVTAPEPRSSVSALPTTPLSTASVVQHGPRPSAATASRPPTLAPTLTATGVPPAPAATKDDVDRHPF